MKTTGRHFVIEAYGCQPALLNDADQLEQILTKSIQDLGIEITHVHFDHLDPQGVTGVVVASSSHITIHTWPEHDYAALDLFTFGNEVSRDQLEDLLIMLSAERAVVAELIRGDEKRIKSSVRNFDLP
jgi:S-adenosylmethionine decarboxylase proenzyme